MLVVAGALEGEPGELEHVGHVRRRRGEADDVAVAGLDPEARLDRADRPERGEHLVQRHAGRQLRRARGAVADRGERGLVDRRVLADLERREVEPERPDLPAQLGDLAVGDARQAVGDERVGDLGQLGLQLVGARVAPGPWRGLADQRGPRPAQSLGDEPEPLAIRLVREAAAELSVGLGQVLRVARQAGRQRPRDAVPGASPRPTVCISRVATAS